MPKSGILRCVSCTEDHVVKSDAIMQQFQCKSCRVGKIRSKYCHLCNKTHGGIIKFKRQDEEKIQREPVSRNHKTCQSDLEGYNSWLEYMGTSPHILELWLNRLPDIAIKSSSERYHFQKYTFRIRDINSKTREFTQHNTSYLLYLECLWIAYLAYRPPMPEIYPTRWNIHENHEDRVFYWNGYQYTWKYDCHIDKHIRTQSENYYHYMLIQQTTRPSSKWFQRLVINPRLLSRKLNCLDLIPIEIRTNIIARMVGHLRI